jgi:protein-S-isoprenylcysteine O-methyltransferase Ste14
MKPNRRRAQVNTLSMAIWLMSTIYSLFLPLQVSSVHFYIGLSVLLVSILLNIAAMVQFAVTPADQPVTTGVYRFSRHPGYVSILLTYLSIGLASASWIFLLITVIWAVLLNISVADEENYCLEKYGRAYRDYLNRTPRWIGRPGK